MFFHDVSCKESLLEISGKTVLTCLCNGAKGFTFLKRPNLQCFPALNEHLIFVQ